MSQLHFCFSVSYGLDLSPFGLFFFFFLREELTHYHVSLGLYIISTTVDLAQIHAPVTTNQLILTSIDDVIYLCAEMIFQHSMGSLYFSLYSFWKSLSSVHLLFRSFSNLSSNCLPCTNFIMTFASESTNILVPFYET